MADATTTLLLDAINQSSERAETACGRIERRMDEGFGAVHGRVNGIAEGLAGLLAEHNRLAPLHKVRMRPMDGDSVMPGARDAIPTGRDWRGFGRVVGWAVAGIAGTGLGALIVKLLEAHT